MADGNSVAGTVVVLGVGNRLRGDDAVGCLVCDELLGFGKSPIAAETGTVPGSRTGPCEGTVPISGESSLITHHSSLPPDVFILDCGSTPENFLQPVADRHPVRILVVDCCSYGAKPGEFRLFSREEIDKLSYGLLSTHTLPLTLTVEMLSLETHATIELLGIQPERIEFGEDLSEPVRRALPAVVEFVRNWARET